MRRIWARALAVGLTSMAALAFAGVLAAREPAAPSNPPTEGGTANGKPKPGAMIETRMDALDKQLNLTDEEKEKIRLLLKHEFERIREVRSNTSLSEGEAHRRIAMVRRNTHDRIAEVLTPEQKQKWQEMRQEHRGAGPKGGQGKPEGPEGMN